MAISFRVTAVTEKGDFVAYFGQLIFTGNYSTGGDSLVNAAGATAPEAFPPGTPGNTASLAVFLLGQTNARVTRPPITFNIQTESGLYTPVLIPGTTAFNFKIKQVVVATGNELAAGAYPAAITGAVFNYLEIAYKKNI